MNEALAAALPVLLGPAGLLNPPTLALGAAMGWRAARDWRQLVVAGFAATCLSVLLDAFIHLASLPSFSRYEGGALAVFAPRFVAGVLAAWVARRLRQAMRANANAGQHDERKSEEL